MTDKLYFKVDKMSSNIENINYDDFKNICRVCMFDCAIKFHLDLAVSNILHKLTDLHFETNDELPQQLCLKCYEKMYEYHFLSFQCKETHSKLMTCLNNFKKIQLKEDVKIEEHKIEFIKVEHVIDEESEINNEQNIIESNDNLFTSNPSNIICGSDKNPDYNNTSSDGSDSVSNNENSNVLTENLYFSNTSNDPNIVISKKSNNSKEEVQNKTSESSDCKPSYKCTKCPKSFTSSDRLSMHMYMHTGEPPFKCDQCSKPFRYLCKMKTHMLVHTGERSFKCDQCSKAFFHLSTMKRHMRTHSGERPFKCDQCSKSYYQLSSMKRHMRAHINKKKCNV